MRYKVLLTAVVAALTAWADTVTVSEFDYYGPYQVVMPLMIDSVDVNRKVFDVQSLLAQPLEAKAMTPSGVKHRGEAAPGADGTRALHMLAFDVENSSYATPSIKVEGLNNYKMTVDGAEAGPELSLRPSTHRVVIKYMSEPSVRDTVRVTIDSKVPLLTGTGGSRLFDMDDVLHGTRITGNSVSADGRYMITAYTTTVKGGTSNTVWRIAETSTGRTLGTSGQWIGWMPKSSRYYMTRAGVTGRELVTVNPADGSEQVLVSRVPDGYITISPDEKKLVVTTVNSGPKEDAGVYQVIEPEDRQPGWRDRASISVYDIETGVLTQVTHGYRQLRLLDVADDGGHILLMVSESRLEKRPTTVMTILSLDLGTMKADTIVSRDGFIGGAIYSPDGRQVLLSGSPESLGGIGCTVPDGRIPSMVDMQLYMRDTDGTIRPLTKDFDPSVGAYAWSRADGKIYFMADDRDCVSLFTLDPVSGKINQVPGTEELVKGFSLPRTGNVMTWYGQSVANPDRLYTLDTRKMKSTFIDEPQRERLAGVKLGECEPWWFVNSRGDSICGRFYLPPGIDRNRKYPLIVNYYGGCSPTSRNFESRYPHHAYAAQDYVVLVLEPSGATGFGQEFSSRHVNTAGKGVAEDIIEGTLTFCREHEYVDSTRIGCIGASYGGFMTQYLQTVTPIFAAAISHAGISDHTSYWGEGYWGYSYSEVSMAESYPWSDPDLYVKQSPLFRADRIHTPLLFLHGDADKNVPPGESIQMFTALKLLGRPTAFVAVADQDHHIVDYDKRRKWQDTIFAWFAKYLKNDSTWWDAMYPPKSL